MGRWFGWHGPGDAEALQARALRFGPHRLSLEEVAERDRQNAHALAHEIGCETTLAAAASPARRPGTLTATKLP